MIRLNLYNAANRRGWALNWGPDDDSQGEAEVCELSDEHGAPIAFRRGLRPANATDRCSIEVELIAEALKNEEVTK